MGYTDTLYKKGHMDDNAAKKIQYEGSKITDICHIKHICTGGMLNCPKICSKYKRES